jgi:hypothetical protein
MLLLSTYDLNNYRANLIILNLSIVQRLSFGGGRNDVDHCLISISVIRNFHHLLTHYRQSGRRSERSDFHE